MVDGPERGVLLGGMSPSEFRSLLDAAELNQRQLGKLAGFATTAVNRWCSETAADRTPAPRSVVALVIAYRMLPLAGRKTLVEQVADLYRPPPRVNG